MKKIALLIVLYLFSAASFAQSVTLTGIIEKTPDPSVIINFPVEGTNFIGSNIKCKLDETGFFKIELKDFKKPGFVKITNNFRNIYLFAEPERIYDIFFGNKKIRFNCPDSLGMLHINSMPVFENTKMSQELDKINGASNLENHINKRIAYLSNVFKKLYSDKKISAEFCNAAINQIKASNSVLLATNLYFKYRDVENEPEKKEEFCKEYMPLWESLYTNINDQECYLYYNDFLIFLVRLNGFLDIKNEGHLVFDEDSFEKSILHSNFLNGRLNEYAWATTIVSGIMENRYEKKWISVFEEFEKKYPNSILLPYVKPYVDRVIEYHSRANSVDKDVVIVENYSDINNFDDVAKLTKGKVAYIDIWATWCSPCRQELRYSIENHEELDKMGVVCVYISTDTDKNDEAWKEMVNSLKIKGLNIRANKSLKDYINSTVPKFAGIPRYIIIDKNGNVVEWNAERPSSGNNLIEQLKLYL